MDSVQPRIDPVSRYGAVNPTDGVQPAGRATVGNRNASQAADTTATPASTTTVTLSRRAQELSAQQTREESRENVQQASDAALRVVAARGRNDLVDRGGVHAFGGAAAVHQLIEQRKRVPGTWFI